IDLVTALTNLGIQPTQIPAKIEGITFGQDVTYNGQNYHTLFIANDNDFVPATAGPNQFYVFGFQDGDLPNYVAESIAVPEPATWAMMLTGFFGLGGMLRARRRQGAAAV
ncbi:MAG TPA: PEPxxWA-CTERM sorting domain-containing protein, partial [Phenylobacterium sp.]|uniref:PEPxxWA-CTERM sorting domain-containing protein n=1 Tax=Phenylobacterium sp. TaxID=1871053 RepID=UPI002B4A96E8